MPVRVSPFEGMDDETSIKHLEHRHAADIAAVKLKFSPEPARPGKPRRFRSGRGHWNIFHEHLHNWPLDGVEVTHEHEEWTNGA